MLYCDISASSNAPTLAVNVALSLVSLGTMLSISSSSYHKDFNVFLTELTRTWNFAVLFHSAHISSHIVANHHLTNHL
jgi:hypothetical protein